MERRIRFLILEDNASDLELTRRELRKTDPNYMVEWARDKETFLQALNGCLPDLVLLDYSVPGFDGLSALALARQRFPDIPAIVVSGAIGEEAAIETLKAGATDYVLKQRLGRLGPAIGRALTEARQLAARKEVERENRRQREWLRVTLDSIGDAVIACDAAGRITFLNPVASSLTGWKQNEAADRPIQTVFRIVNEKTLRPAKDIVRQVLDEKRVLALANHTALATKDGRLIPVEDSAAPILDSDGNLMGVVLVFHDVAEERRSRESLRETKDRLEIRVRERTMELEQTNRNLREEIAERIRAEIELDKHRERLDDLVRERTRALETANARLQADIAKRVEDALRASEERYRALAEELREADRHKNEFMAILSHELRNPLASIQNGLHILDRAVPGGDQAKRAKDVIDRQTGQLAHLVDDLLDVTRINQNKIKLQRERIELNELVRRTLDDHRTLFDRREVRMEAVLSPSPLYVNADGARLAQVIGNLLQNAVKFTHRDGRVTVSVTADSGGRALIRVADTGVGMPPEVLPQIFQAFMQVETTLDRSHGGLGLGLALSKGLVELHGGEISAHSAGINRGSEFTVCLPLDDTAAHEPRDLQAMVPRRNRRVLVIEDNVDLAEGLRELLEFDGHEVSVAYSGAEGLAKACESLPEILLCDIGLPGMDGYAVARAFRADEVLREVYLVALTGYALPEDLQRAAEAGFDRHLAKPPDLVALERMLTEAPGGFTTERPGASPTLVERIKRKGGKIR